VYRFLALSIGLCFGVKALRPAGQRDSALSVPPEGLPQQSVPRPWEQDPLALGRPNRRGTKRRHKMFCKNRITLIGFLGKDAETRFTANGTAHTTGFRSQPM
jgi:hypothetical protein